MRTIGVFIEVLLTTEPTTERSECYLITPIDGCLNKQNDKRIQTTEPKLVDLLLNSESSSVKPPFGMELDGFILLNKDIPTDVFNAVFNCVGTIE